MPQKGNISIGYQAFTPGFNDDLVQWGPGVGLFNLDTHSLYCMASVQLPHGATITNATCYFYDNDAEAFFFYLLRENQTMYEFMTMAFYDGPGSDTPGNIHISASYMDYATVDNNNYYYWLYINLPYSSTSPTNYVFHYALIEYEYPA